MFALDDNLKRRAISLRILATEKKHMTIVNRTRNESKEIFPAQAEGQLTCDRYIFLLSLGLIQYTFAVNLFLKVTSI